MRAARLVAPLAVAALLAGGCGDAGTGAEPAPTATATPAIESGDAARMPEVRAGSAAGSLPAPRSTRTGDPRVLRAAFESSQRLWRGEFEAAALPHRPARLTFFGEQVQTACGLQSRDVGPFYCPASLGVYLNSAFFDALARAYGLRSGFAGGYIVAHEMGHHVQQLLGVHRRVAMADRADPGGENARSVRVELQADCYAGVWLHAVAREGELARGDVEDILRAAAVVGDDFQRQAAGAPLAPETWTHGSSAQRVQWVTTGLERGRPGDCDTFRAS